MEKQTHKQQPKKNNKDQLWGSSKLILLQLQKLLKNSMSTILWLCCIWSNLEKWKNSISGCLMCWPKTGKILFWSVVFSYCTSLDAITRNHLLIALWLLTKSGFLCDWRWPARWLDQEVPKHFWKPNMHQKRVTVSLWRSTAGLVHCSFLNLDETINLRSTLSKWDALNSETPTVTGQQKRPNSSPWQHLTAHCITNASKVERIGLWSFASSAIFTWPLDNWLPLLQAFWQLFTGKCFHNQQEAENPFQEFIKSQSKYFCATGINEFISHWQKCIDCNGSYFD